MKGNSRQVVAPEMGIISSVVTQWVLEERNAHV